MLSLDVHWVQFKNPDVTLQGRARKKNTISRTEKLINNNRNSNYSFGSFEVFHAVDIDVAQQDETFDMILMMVDELFEERHGFQRSPCIAEQKSQVEKSRPEIRFQQNRSL